MLQNFDVYFRHVLEYEGTGYEDVPGDSGGPTKCGITIADVARFNRVRCPARGAAGWDDLVVKVKAVDPTTAGIIYKKFYWDEVRADDLPPGLDYAVVDYAVNSGVHKAVPTLNQLLGLHGDGMANATIEACKAYADIPQLIGLFQDMRRDYLDRISSQQPSKRKFRKGWLDREQQVRTEALLLNKQQMQPSAPVSSKLPRPLAPPPIDPPHPAVVAAKSKGVWGILVGIAGTAVSSVTDGAQRLVDGIGGLMGYVPSIKDEVDGLLQPVTSMFDMLRIEAPRVVLVITIVSLIIGLVHVIETHKHAAAPAPAA